MLRTIGSTSRLPAIAVFLIVAATARVNAAQFIVILRQAGTSYQVLEGEKITVNGKEKVRIGTPDKLELRPEEYKKLALLETAKVGVLRRHAGGYLVHKNGKDWQPVAPDGAAFKAPVPYASVWSSATVALHKDRAAKVGSPVPLASLVAILPGPDRGDALAQFISDESNFRGIGERDASAAWDERMSLLVAVAGSVSGAASEKLQQVLLSQMDLAVQQMSAGISRFSDLQHGLLYAAVSEKAYPTEERHIKARAALTEKRAWLVQRTAILKALNVAELWDAFLDKYGDFERFDNSFEDLRKIRVRAFQESTAQHLSEGRRLYEAKQFTASLRELKLAKLRSPANKEIDALLEAVRIDEARDYGRRVKRVPDDPKSARQTQLRRYLNTAENYIGDSRLSEAETSIRQAEALDKDSPAAMLMRARLLQARKEPLKAIDLLDQYDRRVSTDDEVEQGEALRSKITYELSTTRDKLKNAIKEAESQGNFVGALDSAQSGLKLDPTDLDFVLHAGLNSAILRKRPDAVKLLDQYLQLSQTPGSDEKVRQQVYGFLAKIKAPVPEPDGQPNWFSGYKSPPGLFYCPVSLMPNYRVADVKASRKLNASFQWNNDRLVSIHTATTEAGERDFTAYFDYFKDGKTVRRVSAEALTDEKEEPPIPRFTRAGTVGPGKGTYVGLLNHPVVDPLMAESLTGVRVATVVAGNPYFHPFAWSGVYVFLAEYDDQGRIKSAAQLPAGEAKPPLHTFDFHWDGVRLMEIVERGTGDYRRSMTYAGNKLIGETISSRGKNSKIEYKYRGDQIAEAICNDDPSLDGRSRHVTFR